MMTPVQKWPALVFDLDGTLYTSETILGPAYEAVITDRNRAWGMSYRVPTAAEVLAYVGRPGREIITKLFPDLAPERVTETSDRILVELVALIRKGGGRVFEGVHETLAGIKGGGAELSIVSNCRRSYLEAILETFALKEYFREAWCNEDAPELGKNGLLVRVLAGRKGVMIGDRASDGVAARGAGVPWIGCAFGHSAPDDAELAGADAVIRDFTDLPEALARLE